MSSESDSGPLLFFRAESKEIKLEDNDDDTDNESELGDTREDVDKPPCHLCDH